jgi:hypothetical protein
MRERRACNPVCGRRGRRILWDSDDDGDLECDDGSREQANIRTETGMRLSVQDSAVTNVWFDEQTFAECNGRDLEPATRDAGRANGSALDEVGMEIVTCSLLERLTRNIRVRVMRTLPSGILIWLRLMLSLKMSLHFISGSGFYSGYTPRGPHIFSGRIFHDSSGALEQVEIVYEADLKYAIRKLVAGFWRRGGTEDSSHANARLPGLVLSQDIDCAWF